MNTIGTLYRVTTFGESHGPGLGVVIDGFPAGIKIDIDNIRYELLRRKPGQSDITTSRKEDDEDFEILSGVFEGYSTGHPIAIFVKNKDAKSKDYNSIKDLFRPNHADLTYHNKYGIRDHRGGGRSSGRETVSRVIAGALAKQFLREKTGLEIYAFVKQIGQMIANKIDYKYIEKNKIRTADKDVYDDMADYLDHIKKQGDSVGGIIQTNIVSMPKNIGEPVFHKLKSRLAQGMLGIGGVIGFEYGAGFDIVNMTGSTYNESFVNQDGNIVSKNNTYGGMLGGISTGEDLIFKIAVKPTSSISKPQKTVDKKGNAVDFQIKGRHDPCILPRIVPVVEAMSAIIIMDLYMIDHARRM